MERNSHENTDLNIEQYRMYADLLRQTSLQRAVSNYFFIAVNVAILLTGYIFFPKLALHTAIFFALSVIGMTLCLYWLYELRESHIMNVVRYRTIMELESALFQYGVLNTEWQRIGEYKFRRSPVFFVSLGRMLPILFALGHMVTLGIMISLLWT